MLLPNLILNFAPMTGKQLIFLILTGIAAAGGQIFITKAYAKAPAKEISVYDFSIVIFAAVFGFCFLGQLPDAYSFIGYIIIIGTAILKWRYTMKSQMRDLFKAIPHKDVRDLCAVLPIISDG